MGTIMTGILAVIVWIAIYKMYHRLFNVFYFNGGVGFLAQTCAMGLVALFISVLAVENILAYIVVAGISIFLITR